MTLLMRAFIPQELLINRIVCENLALSLNNEQTRNNQFNYFNLFYISKPRISSVKSKWSRGWVMKFNDFFDWSSLDFRSEDWPERVFLRGISLVMAHWTEWGDGVDVRWCKKLSWVYLEIVFWCFTDWSCVIIFLIFYKW